MSTSPSHFLTATQVFEDEIAALRAALPRLEANFASAVDHILASGGKVVATGVGKSGLVAQKIAATLASTGTSAIFMNGAEALHGDLGFVSKGDVVLMVSNSGSTVELAKMLPSLERLGASIVAIFGKVDTPLARRCHVVLNAHVDKEACPLNLAPMSSSTLALVIGDALAAALMKARNFNANDFALRHPGGILGRRLLLHVADFMHRGDKLPTVAPQATLKEVLLEATRANLGAVCVVDTERTLLGIITDGDIRRHLTNADSLNARADEVMCATPTVITAEASLNQALEIMERRKSFYVLPVIAHSNSRHLVGLLRMHDLFEERN